MGQFTLCAGFWDTLEVLELLYNSERHSTAPLGAWVSLGTYHAAYPDYPVPYDCRRLCGARPRDIKQLLSTGFLTDVGNGWHLGHHGRLWTITYARSGYRAPIPIEVRAFVMERDGHRCVFCTATDDLTLDHIIPWSHGGPDTVDNLRVLCRPCNSRRGNRVEVNA